jgi:ferredoxin-2, mitochondrial
MIAAAVATTTRAKRGIHSSLLFDLLLRSGIIIADVPFPPPPPPSSTPTVAVGGACRCATTKAASTGSSSNNNKYTVSRVQVLDPTVSGYLAEQLGSLADLSSIAPKEQRRLHAKIVQALQPVYGNNVTLAHVKLFGSAGLQALALSILKEEEQTKGGAIGEDNDAVTTYMVQFRVPHHRTEFTLPWKATQSLLEIAEASPEGAELLSEYLEGTCGGNASCCSCHVYIAKTKDDVVTDVNEAEQDMLDLAYQPTEESRLACQVRLVAVKIADDKQVAEKAKNREPILTVTIPSGVNNVWN